MRGLKGFANSLKKDLLSQRLFVSLEASAYLFPRDLLGNAWRLEELPRSLFELGARFVPRTALRPAARGIDWVTNLAEKVLNRWDPITPPVRIRLHAGPFFDSRDYRRSSELNFRALRELSGLQPEAQILDVGCGSGRMAARLTTYLNAAGSYEGFDVGAEPVAWCQNEITVRFPKIRFQVADVQSRRYNPSGTAEGRVFRFPYSDDRFDLAFSFSVYTHMDREGVANYIRETSRVLKAGGMSLATFCLLNEDSSRIVRDGRSSPILPYEVGACRVRDPSDLTSFIAFPESFIRRMYSDAGFEIVEPIHFGSWASGYPRAELDETYGLNQDIVVARKIGIESP
jgi:SAM-dependent methyltransferase